MSEHKNHQRQDSNSRPSSSQDEKPKPTSEASSSTEASTAGDRAKDSPTESQADGANGSGAHGAASNNGMATNEKSMAQGLKGLAEGIVEQAKHVAETKVTDQKTKVADGLGDIAHALRQATSARHEPVVDAVKPYVDKAADRIENVSTYVQDRTLKGMAKDLEDFARREPALFLGGALAIGLIGGRFLKSASPRAAGSRSNTAHAGAGHLGPQDAGTPRTASISGIWSTDGAKGAGVQPTGEASSQKSANPSSGSSRKEDNSQTQKGSATGGGRTNPSELVKDFSKEATSERDNHANGHS